MHTSSFSLQWFPSPTLKSEEGGYMTTGSTSNPQKSLLLQHSLDRFTAKDGMAKLIKTFSKLATNLFFV
jgi:hypothetical protein